MRCKKACLVINPRAGQNIAKLTDVMAILSAAGWKTNYVLKEYGGQTMALATKAAEKDNDLVIGYGGDGTVNQVVNGVMNAKGQHSVVGVIPGGTANVWAGELGIPVDPVKASLTLVNSEARKVDIGHVEIESLTFPSPDQNDNEQSNGDAKNARNTREKGERRKVKPTSKARHHFLLMAGLGIDAAVMGHVSKPLKYKLGPIAVGVSAMKELPAQHPFPIEIRAEGQGREGEVLWQGEAIQVVIGNTRKYADVVQMTPNAYIDDGVLDVAVITAGNPLTTMQQVTSLLLRRKPDNTTTEHFHGSHLVMSLPASIDLQLDGSAVKLKDYLSKSDRAELAKADPEQVMVTYRFDAMPRALRIAIPNTYNDSLFEKSSQKSDDEREHVEHEEQQAENQQEEQSQHESKRDEAKRLEELARAKAFLEHGRNVTVIGIAPNPEKKDTFIVAGQTAKASTGELRPVAVCIDDDTTIIRRTGEPATFAVLRELHEGDSIAVEGKKSKRGVIRASHVVV